jgi:hypothetical protein
MWAGRVTTINILPDDVLLHIFHFDPLACLDMPFDYILHQSWRWHRLVHVCQRWRSVVFASPNFLDLKLVCGPRTRTKLTGIWPPLPVIVRNMVDFLMPQDYDFDAAIVHHNRVCTIDLFHLSSSQLLRLASAMQEPFPALIHLMLEYQGFYYNRDPTPALPDGFSAPRLQSLRLTSIPFPALPKFLLSATDLVELTLVRIPHTGYITPVALVTGLAVSANLKYLSIGFESPLSRPNRGSRRPPPTTRNVLPALTRFEFRGVSEYLEDFVARIDAPLLDSIWITFFNQLIFDIPHFAQFMRRTTRFQAFDEAHVDFNIFGIEIGSSPWARTSDKRSGLGISSEKLDWQLSSLAQVLTPSFPSIDMVEHLYIDYICGPQYLPSQWLDDIEDIQWLEIFHPFTNVKNLYVYKEFAQSIAFALQELVVE